MLGLLNYSDMTGYELAKAFNDSLCFFWQTQTSQIYRELNKMEAGKSELKKWLDSKMPDEMTPAKSEVLLRLFFFSQRLTEENIESLKHLVASYQRQLSVLGETAGTIGQYSAIAHSEKDMLYWEFTADFGRAHCKMVLELAESCIRRLEESKS